MDRALDHDRLCEDGGAQVGCGLNGKSVLLQLDVSLDAARNVDVFSRQELTFHEDGLADELAMRFPEIARKRAGIAGCNSKAVWMMGKSANKHWLGSVTKAVRE